MISLLRQDPALRTLRTSVLVMLAAGLSIRVAAAGMYPQLGERPMIQEGGAVAVYFFMVWFGLMFFLVPSNFFARAGRMVLALPLSARRLWLARVFSLALAGLAPLAAIIYPVSLGTGGLANWVVPDPDVLLLGVRIGSCLVLAVVLFQVPSPDLRRIPMRGGYVLCIGTVACVLYLYLLATPNTALYTVLPLLATAAVGAWTWSRLPAGFVLLPRDLSGTPEPDPGPEEVRKESPGTAPAEGGERRSFPWLLHRTVARVLTANLVTGLFLGLTFLEGAVATLLYLTGRNPLLYMVFAAGFQFPLISYAAARLWRLDPLPISRRLLFVYAALPGLLAVLLGVGAGWLFLAVSPDNPEQVRYRDHRVQAPDEYHEVAWDGRPPAVTAPWGETHTPRPLPLVEGRAFALYDPFEVGPDSSPAFLAWQVDRAVLAVHGVKGLPSESRSRTMAVAVLLLGIITALGLCLALQANRATVRPALYTTPVTAFYVLLLLFLAAAIFGESAGVTKLWIVGVLPLLLCRWIGEALPLATPLLWMVCIAGVAAGYLLVLHTFRRIETRARAGRKPVVEPY